MGKDSDVPQPGPARLSKGAGPDEWLESAKQCKYLPEADMKKLCEIVKECLMEGETSLYISKHGRNTSPIGVSTPDTNRGLQLGCRLYLSIER